MIEERRAVRLAIAAVAALLFARDAEAKPPLARIASVQGTVEAQRDGETAWAPVKLNELYSEGDHIRVLKRSRADLVLLDRSVLRLNENSAITIQPVRGKSTGVVDLLRGAVHIFSRGPDSLAVNTPFTVAGVRGTEFLVEVEAERALVTTFEGVVVASNAAGSVTVVGGQSAVAERGKAPVLRVVARPRDAVQWTLYYPPVLHFRQDEFPDGPGWEGKVRRSLDAYGRGDLARSFEDIADVVPAAVRDQRFFTYRAHLLLAVGRADDARADVERALALSANDPDALALQTVAAVVQNDPERALEIASRAVEAAPTSATARVALSYARQAAFDVSGARDSVVTATQLDPRNALAWARLAELHSSHGDLAEARAAAQRAVALAPELARTQTVLGYAHLMQIDVPAALATFEKAIELDSADPLSRLGLGLAKIRSGDLAGGSRDLETAASLDPGNPIVRSYLGKAYHEEKRSPLDEREYASASEVDPRDPTPWFYAAIGKQTTNRPVEALRDLERAIELNDGRAVYRSRLLLDADLAARSASLGRIYSDLGFQQLALVEGWKSVNADPTNFSAHRFLADSYSVLPRHEIARVSELLQAQLLQPLNVAPIQPSLSESNRLLVGSSGPAALSFNEFNPVFDRDRVVVQPGAVGGSRGLFAGETVVAAVRGGASVSAGISRFRTDGFRPNADQRDDIVNVFAQYQPTADTSVQAEYRRRELAYGDVELRFFEGNTFPRLRNDDDRDTFRVGARHAVSPGSVVIASAMYQRASVHLRDDRPPDFGLTFLDDRTPEQEAVGAEVQHLLRTRLLNLRSGAGYFRETGERHITLGPRPPITTSTDMSHANAYAYADVRLAHALTLSAGASVDLVRGDLPTTGDGTGVASSRSIRQLNPKLGVSWSPLRATTIRVAAARTVKRTLTTNQTIEPTQVAGFNQFFDDYALASAWRYGAAIDQKVAMNAYAGVEVSRRDVDVPVLELSGDPAVAPRGIARSWREQGARAYAFWTPHRWVGLRAEYLHERARRDAEIANGATRVTTHRVPVGIAVFHPAGVTASITPTYVRQSGEFGSYTLVPLTVPIRHGTDQFWLVDAALSYRLPRRYGFASVGVTNLLDRNFSFFETDVRNVSMQPVRTVFGRFTLAFP